MNQRFSRLPRLPRALFIVLGAMLVLTSMSAPVLAQEATPGPTSDSPFFNQDEYLQQLAQREMTPEGPEGKPWVQAIQPEYVDTADYATDPGWRVCFSNAAVDNPWRAQGWTTMQAEVELHSEIEDFVALNAEGDDNQQISDIQDLLNQDCDALIVSPNTTEALTPAIEQACEQVPVIVFDRGVNTNCPVTYVHPIGGYVFGASAAEFVVDNVPEGGNVLALRIYPGVDVLETRWAAAEIAFEEAGINVIGIEFTEGDRAKVKSIVTDYIAQYGSDIDGVWMDAGEDTIAAIEAFQDLGVDVPVITGEDQQDFLRAWADNDLTAIAPTYPNYQWRTPIIAATMMLSGEQVPAEWVLPQPTISQDELEENIYPFMPPLYYAKCGCEEMPGWPENWGGEPAD